MKAVMRGLYKLAAKEGMARLRKLADWLEQEQPAAANVIESPQSGVRTRMRRVCRWRDVAMVERWVAGGTPSSLLQWVRGTSAWTVDSQTAVTIQERQDLALSGRRSFYSMGAERRFPRCIAQTCYIILIRALAAIFSSIETSEFSTLRGTMNKCEGISACGLLGIRH